MADKLAGQMANLATPNRDDFGGDAQGDLLGGPRPEIEANRSMDFRQLLIGQSLAFQSPDAIGTSLPTANRSNVASRSSKRRFERGLVELGIVGQNRDVGPTVDPHAIERFIRPGDH